MVPTTLPALPGAPLPAVNRPATCPTSRLLAQARDAQRSGRLTEAFEACFLALLIAPERADAAVALGTLCGYWQWHEYAELFFQRALSIAPPAQRPAIHCKLGHVLLASGRHAEAGAAYRHALTATPALLPARIGLVDVLARVGAGEVARRHLHFLKHHDAIDPAELARLEARIAAASGRLDEALHWARLAVRHCPTAVVHWRGLLEHNRQEEPWRLLLDESRSLCGSAPALAQRIASAALAALCDAGHWQAVELALARLAPTTPQGPMLYEEAAAALQRAGRHEEICHIHGQARACGLAGARLTELAALAQQKLGGLAQARRLFAEALRLAPQEVAIHHRAGRLLAQLGQHVQALALARRALRIAPDAPLAHLALAHALLDLRQPAAAERACQDALALPNMDRELRTDLLLLLGNCQLAQGKLAQSRGTQALAARLAPDEAAPLRALLTVELHAESDLASLARRHRQLGSLYQRRHQAGRRTAWSNPRVPNRRLRVGIPLGLSTPGGAAAMLATWVPHAEAEGLDVTIYPTTHEDDAQAGALRRAARAWRPSASLDARQLATRISDDGIDILLDVGGYAADNPIEVFALQPCPVQLSWPGHGLGSGMPGMGGVIYDRYTQLPEAEQFHAEDILRMGCSSHCLVPQHALADIAATPALANGFVTFGSLAAPAALGELTLASWVRALRAVPGSRLLLKSAPLSEPDTADALRARLARAGIAADRTDIEGLDPDEDARAAYARIDIVLDTLPVNGGLATLESLWHGVPVLTRCGTLHAGRSSASILHSLGLSSWVAETLEQFEAAALAKTLDIGLLDQTRQRMRDRLRASPAGDGRLFARRMASVLRARWYELCRQK